jgi:hypothetical protein
MVLYMFSDAVSFEDLELPECTCGGSGDCKCPFHKPVKKRSQVVDRKTSDKRYYVKRRTDPERFERYKQQQRDYSRRKRQTIKEEDSEAYEKVKSDSRAHYRFKTEFKRLNGIQLD